MTWEVTQWERSDLARERGRERKAAIMWRVNASAVGEQRRLRQREGRGRRRRKGGGEADRHFAVCHREHWKKRGMWGEQGQPWKEGSFPPFPPPLVSLDLEM